MERDEHAAREEEARYAAEQDGYSRYGGGWVILFGLLSLFASYASAQTLTGPARVVDGDTIEVQGQRVRLHGIDAPEIRQTCTRSEATLGVGTDAVPWDCGVAARRHLKELIARRPVICQPLDKDRYGRTVARCFVGEPNTDLGGWLVRQGLAVAYTRYSTDYLPQEAVAKGARLGVWAGSFIQPEQWRKGVR
jgi:endonuclease YncB( thermonuclease family)